MVKKSSSSKAKIIESISSESPEKEAPPQVMQVVEVMDEQGETPKEEERGEEKNVEVTNAAPIDDVEVVDNEKTQEEKHQEVVSEFFAKKEQPDSTPKSFGYPNISVHKKSSIPGIILWALGVFAIVALIGFIIISVSRGEVKMPPIIAKPTPTVTPVPTAIPTPIVDRKSLKVQVLNGSGTAGVAGTMKALLEEKGYTVAGTGNAKTYDYLKTEIQVTAEKEAFLSILQADLAASYSIGSTAATLKSSSLYDAVVIIGKE